MTSYFSDPRLPGDKPKARPPIWSGGRSARPRIDLRGFGRAALAETRLWGAPVVAGAARHLDRLGDRVALGEFRIPEARLGRSGRYLPTVGQVGAAMKGSARFIGAAGETVAPPPPLEGLAIRPWAGAPGARAAAAPPAPEAVAPPAAAPVAPPAAEAVTPVAAAPVTLPPDAAADHPRHPAARPAPAARSAKPADAGAPVADAERDTLESIRLLMKAEARPVRPMRAATPETAPEPAAAPDRGPRGASALPPLEPALPTPPGLIWRGASHVTGLALIGLFLPVGAARAALARLRGETFPDAE
ncbi:MAG: hypothetical protein KF887_10765 [Paracoccaceae bacterium]|nr:MAG: hypothetical protein KF887_10765 [Paracoccaceae bacterium]